MVAVFWDVTLCSLMDGLLQNICVCLQSYFTSHHIWLLPSQAVLWDPQSCAFVSAYREIRFHSVGANILHWLTCLSASGRRYLTVSMELMWLESRLKEVFEVEDSDHVGCDLCYWVMGDGSRTFQTNAAPSSSRILLDCLSLKALQSHKHVGTKSSNNTVPHPSRHLNAELHSCEELQSHTL